MASSPGSGIIDVFTHIMPPRYKEGLERKARHSSYEGFNRNAPALSDLEARFRIMDRQPGVRHVLTIASPPLEMVVDAATAAELAMVANDEMAELLARYPDRFAAAVACLPMASIDRALAETDRAIGQLGFRGVQIYTPSNGRPLDSPEFMDLYEAMCRYDLPIWIHPARDRSVADYPGESHSRYGIFMTIGWPYETTAAMCRLVFGGIMEKYAGLKLIVHHCGAMLPFFGQRIGAQGRDWLGKPPLDYFRMFYGDTATIGTVAGLMCGYDFFGADHIVFGTDVPYPTMEMVDRTVRAIDAMDIPDSDRDKIMGGNARTLLRLPG